MANTPPPIVACPDCSAVLPFATGVTSIIVCPSCHATIHRTQDGAMISKKLFTITDKADLIQPGSTGRWEERSFRVLGRFRAWFEESVFNYWTILFSNGDIGWLGEGYGLYSILLQTEISNVPSITRIGESGIGTTYKLLDDQQFLLEKKYRTNKWYVEGELFIPETGAGTTFKVLEFAAVTGRHITLFEFSTGPVIACDTKYVSFTDLKFANLRTVAHGGKTFTCGNCHRPVHVKSYPFAQSCACSFCGRFAATDPAGEFKRVKDSPKADPLYLPLGAKGALQDIDYEVIGWAQKEENNQYKSRWREYTLYNPQEGFAFLSEYNGHWIYVREYGKSPVLFTNTTSDLLYQGTLYEHYNDYTYRLVNACGEFPYNIFDNSQTRVNEYIAPPNMWIYEKDAKEGITWYKAQHISPKKLKEAFGITQLPKQEGVGAAQPTGHVNLTKMAKAVLLAIAVLVLVHTITGFFRENKLILDQTYTFPDSADHVEVVTEKFTLDKWSSNMLFNISAPVSNSWFSLSATLVNATTGKEYGLEQGVEYYFGISDGESWREGSTSEEAYLTRIPGGTYFLQLQGMRESGMFSYNKAHEFHLVVQYDVSSDRNFWMSLLILVIWPVIYYWWTSRYETSRWSNSVHANYME